MPDAQREMTFRPRPAPLAGLPLGARSVGRHRALAGFDEGPVAKPFVQVFWGVSGRGAIRLPEGEAVLGPGQVLALLPGMAHHYRSDGAWEFRWWTLDGPLAVELVAAAGLGPRLHAAGEAPEPRFAALREAIADPAGERRASALAYALLLEAAAVRRAADPLVERALAVIDQAWTDPAFGIAALARRLGVHRSGLSRRFRAERGLPPQEHLLHLRINAAIDLLTATTLPVAAVAHRCGFADPAYFARLLRSRTGAAPSGFRGGR